MPGLERAMEVRPEVRQKEGTGPQGAQRQLAAGGPEGARGAGREAGSMVMPVDTPDGQMFAVIPTVTPDGKQLEPEHAVELVRAGEMEPIGVFPTMEEAEAAQAQAREGSTPTADKGLGARAMGPPPDKQRAMR